MPNFIDTQMINPAGILEPLTAAAAVASGSGVDAVLLDGIVGRRQSLFRAGVRRGTTRGDYVAADLLQYGAGGHYQ